MQTQDAYNDWAKTHDSIENKTRDLEAKAISGNNDEVRKSLLIHPAYV